MDKEISISIHKEKNPTNAHDRRYCYYLNVLTGSQVHEGQRSQCITGARIRAEQIALKFEKNGGKAEVHIDIELLEEIEKNRNLGTKAN